TELRVVDGEPVDLGVIVCGSDPTVAALRGQVVGPRGQPAIGADIEVAVGGKRSTARVDRAGRFTLQAVPAGRARVAARWTGYSVAPVEVDLVAGATAEVLLTADEELAAISGRVTAA